jgi:hypothetical protein
MVSTVFTCRFSGIAMDGVELETSGVLGGVGGDAEVDPIPTDDNRALLSILPLEVIGRLSRYTNFEGTA